MKTIVRMTWYGKGVTLAMSKHSQAPSARVLLKQNQVERAARDHSAHRLCPHPCSHGLNVSLKTTQVMEFWARTMAAPTAECEGFLPVEQQSVGGLYRLGTSEVANNLASIFDPNLNSKVKGGCTGDQTLADTSNK